MAAASAQLAISRINEDWGASEHGSFYREVEMERKRWMLSALDRINKLDRNAEASKEEKASDESTTNQLLLLLFETQGKLMASFQTPRADLNSYCFVPGGGSSHGHD